MLARYKSVCALIFRPVIVVGWFLVAIDADNEIQLHCSQPLQQQKMLP